MKSRRHRKIDKVQKTKPNIGFRRNRKTKKIVSKSFKQLNKSYYKSMKVLLEGKSFKEICKMY